MDLLEKWLNDQELAEMEYTRLCYDLEGWEDAPTRTFSAASGVPWLDGDVTEADRLAAASIRARLKLLKGRKDTHD